MAVELIGPVHQAEYELRRYESLLRDNSDLSRAELGVQETKTIFALRFALTNKRDMSKQIARFNALAYENNREARILVD